MAMLILAHNWTKVWGVRLWVVTIDHGLRPESAAEAAMVAGECAILGHPHAVLRWRWEGQGNKMDAARRARLSLIDQWRGRLRHVLMAHTQDDVAETFLMRLQRGSGVDGLSAMAERRRVSMGPSKGLAPEMFDGVLPEACDKHGLRPAWFDVVRPCLGMTREELRQYLRVLKSPWVDDPSNEDASYARVRMRHLLPDLEQHGLGQETLTATARRLSRAKEALWARAADVWGRIGEEGRVGGLPTGEILFARDGFAGVERETQLRLLAAALQYISGAVYRPRAEALEHLLEHLLGGGGAPLHGCEARAERDQIRVFREYKPVAGLVVPHGPKALWDGRWRIWAPQWRNDPGVEIRALGEAGWQQISERLRQAPPHRSARSLPALWCADRLLACDALGFGPGTTTHLHPHGHEGAGFARFLLSH